MAMAASREREQIHVGMSSLYKTSSPLKSYGQTTMTCYVLNVVSFIIDMRKRQRIYTKIFFQAFKQRFKLHKCFYFNYILEQKQGNPFF